MKITDTYGLGQILDNLKDRLLREPLLHGDEAHRAWLTAEITKQFELYRQELMQNS